MVSSKTLVIGREANILKLFDVVEITPPRREPQIFAVPYNRLHSTDKNISHVGPKLYNRIVIAINKDKPSTAKNLQNKFLNPFKAAVTKHLLGVQALEPNIESWEHANFALY